MMIHPSTNLHHYPSIRLSTYPFICLSIYLYKYPSIYLPIHSLNYLSTYLSIYSSIYLPIHQSSYHSLYLSIHLSIYTQYVDRYVTDHSTVVIPPEKADATSQSRYTPFGFSAWTPDLSRSGGLASTIPLYLLEAAESLVYFGYYSQAQVQ